jgi:hypothetical protein
LTSRRAGPILVDVSAPLSDLHYAPSVSKRFTSFASALDLNRTPSQVVSATTGPAKAGGRPVQVVIEVTTADTHFDYTDDGDAVTMNFDAVGTYVLRCSPASVQTTTNVAAVTVFWMPRQA